MTTQEKLDYENLPVGTKIYYTGNPVVAMQEASGEIVEVMESETLPKHYKVKLVGEETGEVSYTKIPFTCLKPKPDRHYIPYK